MKKVDSVISLIHTLTKSEKKHFHQYVVKDNAEKDFLVIYDIIINSQIYCGKEVKQTFYQRRPRGSFEVSIQYLYERLVDTLLMLRRKKDSWYDLYTNICKARMLFERGLFHECFDTLAETVEQAQYFENNEALQIALKQELDCLQQLNFPGIDKEELLQKQKLRDEAVYNIQKITGQLSVYENSKYYQCTKSLTGPGQDTTQPVIPRECHSFELKKNYLLLQANHLVSTGDIPDTLATLKEINTLFENHKNHWANPPVNYLSTLENSMDYLRAIKQYDAIPYYLDRLKELIALPNISQDFEINAYCLLFQYEICAPLANGDFKKCNEIMDSYQNILYNKISGLNPIRKNELIFYTALIHLGNQNIRTAQKTIMEALPSQNINYLPLMRSIRLLRIMLWYETGDFEQAQQEARDIRRDITLKKEKAFETEHRLFWFINRRDLPVLRKDRLTFWNKLAPVCQELRNNGKESQILRIFDFTAWIEAKILKKPLSEVLTARRMTD